VDLNHRPLPYQVRHARPEMLFHAQRASTNVHRDAPRCISVVTQLVTHPRLREFVIDSVPASAAHEAARQVRLKSHRQVPLAPPEYGPDVAHVEKGAPVKGNANQSVTPPALQ